MATLAPVRIEAPTATRRKFDLFSVADVRSGDSHFAFGAEWESLDCGTIGVRNIDCISAAGNKTPQGGAVGTLDTFSAHAIIECSLFDMEVSRKRANRILELGASRAVEIKLATKLGADAHAVGTTHATVVDAVAALEEAAATVYYGQPTILSDVEFAVKAVAAQAAYVEMDRLYSAAGSPWATSPAFTAKTAFAVGPIVVLQGELIEREGFNLQLNLHNALAERVLGFGYDCACASATCLPLKATLV